MKICSLMLGSIVASVAVSGAFAADAVVEPEPEAVDYMQVCDTYGVGFYFIPGTETCLKVSGYVRYDLGAGALGLYKVIDKKDFAEDPFAFDRKTNDTYDALARFQLRLDARSETELGTLRAYAAINFQFATDTTDSNLPYYNNGFTDTVESWSPEHIYVELAGFRVGKTDSLFTTFTGYAGGVINDDIIGYGPYDTHQIAYSWSGGNGFSAAVALEEGSGNAIMPFQPNYNYFSSYGDLYTLDSYTPHVAGGVGWNGAWGGVSLVAGYDSVWDQGAVKGRLDIYPTDALALFVMAGWASVDEDLFWYNYSPVQKQDSPNFYAPWGGEWAVWAGASLKLTDKATFNVQASYDKVEDFALVANIAYEVVPNFVVTPEIAYMDNFDSEMDDYVYSVDYPLENWGFFVRAQANFGG
ncbi:MAG: porin [Hyphomicrobiales bacterium]|nr:porin [Hyphomicrobiales bacterium]